MVAQNSVFITFRFLQETMCLLTKASFHKYNFSSHVFFPPSLCPFRVSVLGSLVAKVSNSLNPFKCCKHSTNAITCQKVSVQSSKCKITPTSPPIDNMFLEHSFAVSTVVWVVAKVVKCWLKSKSPLPHLWYFSL